MAEDLCLAFFCSGGEREEENGILNYVSSCVKISQ